MGILRLGPPRPLPRPRSDPPCSPRLERDRRRVLAVATNPLPAFGRRSQAPRRAADKSCPPTSTTRKRVCPKTHSLACASCLYALAQSDGGPSQVASRTGLGGVLPPLKTAVASSTPSDIAIQTISLARSAAKADCRQENSGSPPFVLKTEEETFGQPFRRGQETRAEQTRPAPNRPSTDLAENQYSPTLSRLLRCGLRRFRPGATQARIVRSSGDHAAGRAFSNSSITCTRSGN